MQRYEKFGKVGWISQGKFASHHRWQEFVSHTDGYNSDLYNVPQRSASQRVTLATGGTQEIAEIAEMGPSQMANKGRTDGTDYTDIRPSQMAGYGVA